MNKQELMGIDKSQYNFEFHTKFFSRRNLSTFREFIYPEWAGKPLTYLEIGVFEGMSLVWMLQYILTHKKSRAIGCDPWLEMIDRTPLNMEEIYRRAQNNTEPYRDKCTLVRGNSAQILRKMLRRSKSGYLGIKKNSIDLILVDGSHHSLGVLDDARLCFRLIKPGGWLLFDDVENDLEKRVDHVKHGLALFQEEMGNKIERVWKHKYMEAYRKVTDNE